MAKMNQYLCLKWNNHQSTLVTVLNNLLLNERLIDVTLYAEGQLVGAHKIVLSACSSYFEHLFSSCGDKHPVIILKDVKYQDLRSILDYMYHGELQVAEDQLPELIKTASSLKIKGLFEGTEETPCPDENNKGRISNYPAPKLDYNGSPACENKVLEDNYYEINENGKLTQNEHIPSERSNQCTVSNLKVEENDQLTEVAETSSESVYACELEFKEIEDEEFELNDQNNISPFYNNEMDGTIPCDDSSGNSKLPYGIQRWTCERCGRSYKNRPTLTRHLKLECGVVPKFKCPMCTKPFKRREHVREHIQYVHKIKVPS